MLRTEEEAKQCWCPFARSFDGGGDENLGPWAASYNRTMNMIRRLFGDRPNDELAAVENNCIGSACMAWRWGDGPEKASDVRPHIRDGETLGQAYGRMCRGYCGLAGKPET